MTFYAATLRQQQRLVTRRRGSTVIGPGVRCNIACNIRMSKQGREGETAAFCVQLDKKEQFITRLWCNWTNRITRTGIATCFLRNDHEQLLFIMDRNELETSQQVGKVWFTKVQVVFKVWVIDKHQKKRFAHEFFNTIFDDTKAKTITITNKLNLK